jgi:hypothetical protein
LVGRAQQKPLRLIGAGVAMALAGHLIRSIWTSSSVLETGGYSLLLLGIMHQVIAV